MKMNPLNKKMLAVVCSAVLFAGMGMMTYAQEGQHKKKKNEEQTQPPPDGTQYAQQDQQPDTAQYEQRMAEYRQHLDQQQQAYQQNMAKYQQDKRMSQYRYQQRYSTQMNQQWQRYGNGRINDYRNDPFFRTPFDRRYNRGGTYYMTNRYGVAHLQQAIQYGYEEGFRAGMADRRDHWRFDYKICDAYRDANYGYNGYYVRLDDYNYYFREGFQRGYEDGYYRRYQYGRYANGRYSILDSILGGIIRFEMIRR